MNIYVGNLAFNVTEDELRQAFEGFDSWRRSIIKNKFTGQSKGFSALSRCRRMTRPRRPSRHERQKMKADTERE